MQLGGTPYPVFKGRRDTRVSKAADVAGNLPSPADGVDNLLALFIAKGLDINDLIALSGNMTLVLAQTNTTDLYFCCLNLLLLHVIELYICELGQWEFLIVFILGPISLFVKANVEHNVIQPRVSLFFLKFGHLDHLTLIILCVHIHISLVDNINNLHQSNMGDPKSKCTLMQASKVVLENIVPL